MRNLAVMAKSFPFKPLGDFRQFPPYRKGAHSWGPEGKFRSWFGGGVLDGLIETIDEHLNAVPESSAVAVGCVPWFTASEVATRLGRMRSCVVINKPKGAPFSAVNTLNRRGEGIDKSLFWQLDQLARTDNGDALVVGPYGEWPPDGDLILGPVRVAGYQQGEGRPLVHSKMLLLGSCAWGEDEFGREERFFAPSSLWWGSANWTQGSRKHLETGFWSDDRALLDDARDFLIDLIAFSEPLGAVTTAPEPELRNIEWDDEAMREAMGDAPYDEDDE